MFAFQSSHFSASAATTSTSLAEIMGAFSYALDLAEGQPAGHSLRCCWIGSRIAQALALGQVIDAKSPYTSGHSERVGDYCDAVAAELGISGPAPRQLRRAAVLHDVGKLAVSCTVLEKPGKLDDDEWEVMRSHASHTAEILSRIGPMREMAMIAAAHHERLDGRGYPLGLDDATISIESRIITVCDFYDALTADRPYRAAMSAERALAIMGEEVGSAIDADCFAALSAVVARGDAAGSLPAMPGVLR